MKKLLSTLLIFSVLLSLAVFPATAAEQGRGMVYVATNGNDNAEGTIDKPLATLQGAQKKVRAMKASGKYPKGIVVCVRGGDYNVSEALVLTEEDSGTEEAPIIWRNYEDEEVTFVGGINVSGKEFKKVTDQNVLSKIIEGRARDLVYSLDLKKYGYTEFGDPYLPGAYSYGEELEKAGLATQPKSKDMEFLFNGQAMTNARYPNEGDLTVKSVIEEGDATTYGKTPIDCAPFEIVVDDDRIKYWTNAPQDSILMFGFWKYAWADQTIPLHKIDLSRKSITSAWYSKFKVEAGKPFYVFNLIEELDAPGEFFLDRDNGILYIIPPSNISESIITVTIMEENLFQLRNASNITLKGFKMKGSRAGLVTISGGENNLLVDCDLSYTAKFAVSITGKNNGMRNCYVHDVDGGVSLNGGEIVSLTPSKNYVINNHFERFSRLTKTYVGAVDVGGVGNIVAYNEMHDAPHLAVSFNGQLNKIMYNEIYHVLRETDDAGAFYGGLNWEGRGVEMKYNYFHDIKTEVETAMGIMAIYGDGGQCEMYICGNVFENIGGHAAYIGGSDNVALNNIMISCEKGIEVDDVMLGYIDGLQTYHYPRGAGIREQLLASPAWDETFPTYKALLARPTDLDKVQPLGNVVHNNLAYNGSAYVTSTSNFTDTKQNLSVGYDPGFVNLAEKDYNLKPDSMVFEKLPGFKPIPFTRMGRCDERAQIRAQDAILLCIDSPKSMVKGQILPIDENEAIVPYIEGDRTRVPLRFLAESLGATVDFADGVITISSSTVNLELALNSLEGKKNGEAITLENELVVIDGRTFVPLREVSELLDKQVFWHEAGFISVSDDPTLFDAEGGSDDEIITYLHEQIKAY